MLNRREFNKATLLGLAAAEAAASGSALAQQAEPRRPPNAPGPGAALRVAAVVYPDMILLDLAGPMTVFNIMRADIQLVAKARSPVRTDVGISLSPTMTFDEPLADVDVLFVPGGLGGTVAAMNDADTVAFVRACGSTARHVTSVCTGSLLLGAAGLLAGYEATSHWYVRDLLPLMGARLKAERVVIDRNRITGGGVTAGIDFALTLVSQMVDRRTAEAIQLRLEYNPSPPFNAGSPDTAPADILAMMKERIAPAQARRGEMIGRAAARMT
jgi:cyclohexyl-isocyanide hydratase